MQSLEQGLLYGGVAQFRFALRRMARLVLSWILSYKVVNDTVQW